MRGREGDLFYRALFKEPIEKQLDIIKRLGFAGIYIDRRGFKDRAQVLIKRLSVLSGVSLVLKRRDEGVVFFQIDSPSKVDFSELSPRQIMEKVGYVADKDGPRYPSRFSEEIDFTRYGLPEFIHSVEGLSALESWGRWSDANISPVVRFNFITPLPQKFILVLLANPFGPNTHRELVIKVGPYKRRVSLREGLHKIRVSFDLMGEEISFIEFIPPKPTSPLQLRLSLDSRKLGLGFVKLHFEE